MKAKRDISSTWTRRRESRSSSGFSLLEVIAALFILSVGILALTQLFSTSLRSVERSDRHSRASVYARSLLEEAYTIPDIEDVGGTFDLKDGFRATRTAQELSTEELDVSDRKVSLYEVRVVVVWPPNGHLELAGKKMVYEKPD
jgi:general secretion pathway protein I